MQLRKKLPVLLICGAEDPVGQYGAGPRWIYGKLEEAGHPAVLRCYPDGRHEMLNERNRIEVWHDIAAWIDTLAPADEAN